MVSISSIIILAWLGGLVGEKQVEVTAFEASYYEARCEGGPSRTIPSKLYRASDGRIRVDHYFEVMGQQLVAFRRIYDPGPNVLLILNDSERTILKSQYPPGREVAMVGLFTTPGINPDCEQWEIGARSIEGLECRGYRLGNFEYWTSEKLNLTILAKNGDEVIMRICDIRIGEPDSSLFEVPPDYDVKEERNHRE